MQMKLIGASLVESIKKLALFPIKVISSNNKRIVNKNIQQHGDENIFVGGDFNTSKYQLQINGAVIDRKKKVVKMELYKVYKNGEPELVKDAYWSMYVPNTQGGWVYNRERLQNIIWSQKDSPFTEVVASLHGKDHSSSEDKAGFSYDKFLEVVKNS